MFFVDTARRYFLGGVLAGLIQFGAGIFRYGSNDRDA